MIAEARGHVIAILERFGVPVAILATFLLFAREAAMSVHSTILVPIVQSHTEFLETTREAIQNISESQRQQADTMQELQHSHHELHQAFLDKYNSAESVN